MMLKRWAFASGTDSSDPPKNLVWRLMGCFMAGKLALVSWLALGYTFWPSLSPSAQEVGARFVDLVVMLFGVASLITWQGVLAGLSSPRFQSMPFFTKYRLLFAALVVGIALRYAAESLSIGWMWLFNPDGLTKLVQASVRTGKELNTATISDRGVVTELIFGTLVSPIVEEIVYRGILLRQFCRVLAPHWAVLLSAVLFSTMHSLSPSSMLAGMVFGYLFLYTGNVIYPMLAHSASNGLVLLYPYLSWNLSLISVTGAFSHSWQIAIALSAWLIVLSLWWLATSRESCER